MIQVKEDALAEAFISANLDFSLLNNVAFREFVKILDPFFQLPNRAKLTKLINAAAEKKAKKIAAAMKNEAVAIALTSDVASTSTGASVSTITAHWLSKEWELLSAVIALRGLWNPQQHEPPYLLSSVVQEDAKSWRIDQQAIAVTTDGVVNDLLAATTLPEAGADIVEERIRCWCHSLHLSVTFSLEIPEVGELIDEQCSSLVSLCEYDHAVSETLHELQQLRIEKELERKGQEQKNSRAAEEPVDFLDIKGLDPLEWAHDRQFLVQEDESVGPGRYR